MAKNKSWDDLLWLYMTDSLSQRDRAVFEFYLAQDPSRQAELDDWQRLKAAIQTEVSARVRSLPALNLTALGVSSPVVSLNGSHHQLDREDSRDMTTTYTTRYVVPGQHKRRRQSQGYTLAAAVLAAVAFVGVLLMNGLPDNNQGAGALQQGQTESPADTFAPTTTQTWTVTSSMTPSVTWTPTPLPSRTSPSLSTTMMGTVQSVQTANLRQGPGTSELAIRALLPGTRVEILGQSLDGQWLNVRLDDETTGWISTVLILIDEASVSTATPIPVGSVAPTVPPYTPFPTLTPIGLETATPIGIGGRGTSVSPNPVASITPSLLEPIVSAPSRLDSQFKLPGGDVGNSVAWSSAHSLIAVGSMTSVWLLDPTALETRIQVLPFHPSHGVVALEFSPDGTLLAVLDWDANLSLWRLNSETDVELLSELPASGLWGDLLFTDDNRTITSTLSSWQVTILDDWRLNPGVPLDSTYQWHDADVNKLVRVEDNKVMVFDAASQKELDRFIVNEFDVIRVVFSPDGSHLAAQTSMALYVFDIESGVTDRVELGGTIHDIAFAPDNSQVAYNVYTNTLKTTWVWNLETDNRYAAVVYDIGLNDLAFSPDGQKLSVISGDGLVMTLDVSDS